MTPWSWMVLAGVIIVGALLVGALMALNAAIDKERQRWDPNRDGFSDEEDD